MNTAVLNIEAAVLLVIAQQLGARQEDLARENTLADLGADSLDLIELVMACEDEFTVTIEDEEVEKLRTVGDVIDLVRRKGDPDATVPGK